MERGVKVPKVAPPEGRRHLAQRSAITGLIRIRPEAPCAPSCGLGGGPSRGVCNQIRKVVEGMHWRMHDEPSFTIGSHRGRVPYRNHRKNKTTRITYCIWLYFFLFLVKFAKLTVCFSSRCTGIRSNLIEFNVFD